MKFVSIIARPFDPIKIPFIRLFFIRKVLRYKKEYLSLVTKRMFHYLWLSYWSPIYTTSSQMIFPIKSAFPILYKLAALPSRSNKLNGLFFLKARNWQRSAQFISSSFITVHFSRYYRINHLPFSAICLFYRAAIKL